MCKASNRMGGFIILFYVEMHVEDSKSSYLCLVLFSNFPGEKVSLNYK